MNKTIAIISLAVLVALAAALALTVRSEEPIQVAGDLSKREITDIRAAVFHYVHPPILPDLSARSLKAAPGLILERFGKTKPKIWKIEARTHGFVAVIGRAPQEEQNRPYVFWGVL